LVTAIRRLVTALICLIVMGLLLQWALTRDAVLDPQFILRVAETDANGRRTAWQFTAGRYWDLRIDGTPASVQDAMTRLRSAKGTLSMTGTDANGVSWTAARDANGSFKLDGKRAPQEALERRVAQAATPPPDWKPTVPVMVTDVLEANLPMPTRSKVSFPELAYKDAFPEANDEPEIVITAFDEAPMLKYFRTGSVPAGLPPNKVEDWKRNWDNWRQRYPKDLPPVAERLPRNPAVVVGPDGIGQYGGIWRRCTYQIWDLTRKLCYESLTRHDPSGRIQPCLAYKWEVSPDNRVYTFYLRKGHKWSDGVPFTSHDIAWVCNQHIGHPDSASPPEWMLATDGSMALYDRDVADWPKLARLILDQAEANEPATGKRVMALAGDRLRKTLRQAAAGSADEDTAILIAADLNELFRRQDLFDPQTLATIDTDADQRDLESIGASKLTMDQLLHLVGLMQRAEVLGPFRQDPNSLEPIELNRMNLLLFRTAYRGLVGPPRRDILKVEPVPDEHGDDSHIVRFTFPRPNSIFLETTTTFMFYLYFATATHARAPLHPRGSKVLAPTDFWRWADLWARVQDEARADAPSPGKRLWALLDEPTRQKIPAGLPPGNSGEDEWLYDRRAATAMQPVIDAINEALASPAFFAPEAWPGFNIEQWKKLILEETSLRQLARDPQKFTEYRDVLILDDLLRRRGRDGPKSLSNEEHQKLGILLFRWTYGRGDEPLVARTRTMGLDRTARRHPRKYTSATTYMNDLGNYHPEYNPHNPVLHAWRLVDEKDKPEIMAVRNPYYYRVDAKGNQLPYIDAIRTAISREKQVRLLKMRSGNVDFQAREIIFEAFTPLKQNEKGGDYQVFLWAHDYCGEVTYCPIQAHKDPMYLKLNEDPNFRYALSLALNRREMIDVVFAGMGIPAQFSVPEGSPYYSEKMAKAFIEYDPNRANRLLDAMGLDKRARDGTRLLWDGRPLIMDVNVVSGGEVPLAAVRLACHYWQQIGINAMMKFRTNAMMYRMEELGISDMRVHKEGGNYYGPIPPGDYYPSHPAEAVQWYQWADYMRSGGRRGKPAPERIKELERLYWKMIHATNEKDKMAAWRNIAERFTRDLPIIGIMTSPGKVVICKNNFKNVPRVAMAGWIAHEPGNCCTESFFFDHYYKRKK